MVIFETAVKGVSVAMIQRFARQAQKLAKVPGEVDILISSNKRLQELNLRFRHKNKPTDVLSFPRPSGGDIAISADIARQNAILYGHSHTEELKILVLHGMLHLAGHDHESDNGQMARTESRLRTQLKLPASLIDRAHRSVAQKAVPTKTRAATSTINKRRSKKSATPIARRTPRKVKVRKAKSARSLQ
jgi:probable rRNA maturation factor